MIVSAILGLPQGSQRLYSLISDMGDGRDPLLAALAVPHGHQLVLKVNIIPAERHNLGPVQTGIDHQSQYGIVAHLQRSAISFGISQRS